MNTIAIQRYVHLNPPTGPQFSGTTVLFGDRMDMLFEDDVAPTSPSVLTTRDSDNAGTFTMSVAHTFVATELVDIYWVGGMRRHMVVASTTGNDPGSLVSLSGGTGDVLPAASTVVNISKIYRGELDNGFAGTTVRSVVFSIPGEGSLSVRTNSGGGTELKNYHLTLGGIVEKHGSQGDELFDSSNADTFEVSLNNPTISTFLAAFIYGNGSWAGLGIAIRDESDELTEE